MSKVPPALQDLAERLLAFEAVHGGYPSAPGEETVRVLEKLRSTLSKLMGVTGFRAILNRTLALAKAEVPVFGGLRVQEDGSLEGFEAIERNMNTEDARIGGAILVGQFLGLMVTFIGIPLTLRLLHDIWPEDSMDGMDVNDMEDKI